MTKGLSLFEKRRRRNRTALRARGSGRPRLSIHRSGQHIYAPALLKRLSELAPADAVIACDVGQHQMHAERRADTREFATEARTGAGDDRNLALEIVHLPSQAVR